MGSIDYTVSTAVEYGKDDDGKSLSRWTNCGVAFKGDKGITVLLDALPVNGKLFLSKPLPKKE